MVFVNLFILVLWTKVALAFEGLKAGTQILYDTQTIFKQTQFLIAGLNFSMDRNETPPPPPLPPQGQYKVCKGDCKTHLEIVWLLDETP